MVNSHLVTVIIPTYNSGQFLNAAVNSVLSQSYPNIEIIVVDDGSTDLTRQILQPYLSRIHYVYEENRGPSAARNQGIHFSQGDYLVFLDADDQLLPEKIAVQSGFLDIHLEIDVVYSDGFYKLVRDTGEEHMILFSKVGLLNPTLGRPEVNIPVYLSKNAFPIHSAMVRREAVLRNGGFDENMTSLEDWDFWYRLAWRSSFIYLNFPTVIYTAVASGLSKNKTMMINGSKYFEHKVEESTDFKNLPLKFRSIFYFRLGLSALKLDAVHLAKQRFRKAVQCNPGNLLAVSAMIFSSMLGDKAVLDFYRFLHRKLTIRDGLGL